jgi:hypothetical protein
MNITLKIGLCFLFLSSIINGSIEAQYASRKISKKQQSYTDSLKQVEYKYIFPILGSKFTAGGLTFPTLRV